ncbi:MAG: Gar1/Naf1 family protein [Methanosarcina sp.]|jgi:RNA-binding protein|nr:Gar1/Naf1 family protein [Methanosarcina sp.]MDD3316148.1 Gar1/Naf1 family protein [Methanosarcina sp.]MDD4305472.1 Gar1/Naf1 family protein [Methanosarcina sp.]MDD4619727.1 Gar1/Naf1 family protein [Methanosarcina sp.]NLN44286.1 H/ACA RNA-protein complex protein Gar1 [Methanosarcina sp.]
MKRLGKVLHRAGVKNLIIRGDEIKPENISGSLPKLNSVVVDKALNRIGTIVSVFGPVNHPYFLVKGFKRTSNSEFRALVNERVYVR